MQIRRLVFSCCALAMLACAPLAAQQETEPVPAATDAPPLTAGILPDGDSDRTEHSPLLPHVSVLRAGEKRLAPGESSIFFANARKASATVRFATADGTDAVTPLNMQVEPGMYEARISTHGLPAGEYQLTVTSNGVSRARVVVVR